jgi:hypothetical protein
MIPIESRVNPHVEPRFFRIGGKAHYTVRVFLAPEDSTQLAGIEKVVYTLHESFKDRYRVSTTPPDYAIEILTYGNFEVRAEIIREGGTIEPAEGMVRVPSGPAARGEPPAAKFLKFG